MIKEHNIELNQSYNSKDKFLSYKDYRDSVMKHILNTVRHGQSLLIVGAGNLNDIDMSLLTDLKVSLLDIDKNSVIEGLLRQGMKPDEYKIIQGDLTGLDETDFFDQLHGQTFERYFEQSINISLASYDLIVILPVYTQLLLPQLMTRFDYQGLSKYLPLIQNRINTMNEFLRNHLKDKGCLLVFSDVLEYRSSQEAFDYLNAHKNHPMILEEFYESYLSAYGHGLGSYGLYEMGENLKVIREDFLIWPFSQERLMLIKMILTR